MASQLARAGARKLYSFDVGGSLRTLGCTARASKFSTQGSTDEPCSEDSATKEDFQVTDVHQGSSSDATTEGQSLDSQVAKEPLNTERPRFARQEPGRFFAPRGVHKAIILGEVGLAPIQKVLKSGRMITIFSVGTGGVYNNRAMLDGESAKEYSRRNFVQWHRIAVYQDKLANLVRSLKPGTQVYVEGNIELRIYDDPKTGMTKRLHEIAVRQNGRLLFMEPPSRSNRESQSQENHSKSPESTTTGQTPPVDQPLQAQV